MFRNRNITLAVAARFISRVGGTAVFFVGIWGVAAYQFRVDAATLAILMAGNSIAGILGSVIAGVLVDRVGPRRVLLLAEILTIPVVIWLSFVHAYPVFVGVAWLFAFVASPTFTATAAFAPYLTSGAPRELERINGWIEAAGSAGFVLGPALGEPRVPILATVHERIEAVRRYLPERHALLLVSSLPEPTVRGTAATFAPSLEAALVRARALETQCYLLAAGQGGWHPGPRETYGHSAIVDPWGRLLAERAQGEGVLLASRDAEEQAAIRQRMPVHRHRRFSVSAVPRPVEME